MIETSPSICVTRLAAVAREAWILARDGRGHARDNCRTFALYTINEIKRVSPVESESEAFERLRGDAIRDILAELDRQAGVA